MVHSGAAPARWAFGAVMLLFAAVFVTCPPATAQAQATDPGSQVVNDAVPIEIRPGAVRVEWTVERGDLTAGCTSVAWIRPEGAARPIASVYAVRLSGAGDALEAGQTPLDAIPPGRYLLNVGGSGCWWTINIVEW